MPTFTPVYDWIAERKDLSLLEKLIISKVLRYGSNGCYESYRSIARKFGVDHSAVIRAVKELISKEWLCVLYEAKYKRILYVMEARLSPGPLFELPGLKDGGKPVKSTVKTCPESGGATHQSGAKSGQSGGATHHVVNNVSYIDDRMKIQEEISFLSDVMTDEAKPRSKAQLQHKAQRQVKDMLNQKA